MPLYYFEAEGPGWSDYQDDDGIELQSDAEALAYAYSMIRELKVDYEGGDSLTCSSRIVLVRQSSALPSSNFSTWVVWLNQKRLFALTAPLARGFWIEKMSGSFLKLTISTFYFSFKFSAGKRLRSDWKENQCLEEMENGARGRLNKFAH